MGRRRSQKRRRFKEQEEEDEMPEKRRASVYFDDIAEEDPDADEYEGGEEEEEDDGFFVHSAEDDIPDDNDLEQLRIPRTPLVNRRDEEMDVEAMEKMINERYGPTTSLDYNDEDLSDNEMTEVEQQTLLASVRDPKLWLVKCLPGREREVAALLMQKSLDKDSSFSILSAIALDYLKGYIYVESYCQAHVMQACKGVRNVYARNITMVPLKEMSNVLSVDSHDRKDVHVSRGDWVRLKRSSHKGNLGKVVDVDTVRHKVTVKVTPKLSALSLSDKLEGVDYLYKTVALSSVATKDINPSIEEVENFKEVGETDADMATLFNGKQKGCWMRGDAVVVVKGELKNLKGFVENVKGDIVHIRPKDEKIPMKTVAVRGNELAKYFEPGRQVKVICGQLEGSTGMVVKVDQHKLVILSDATKDLIAVFSAQVVESNEKSENSSKIGIVCSNPDSRHDKISASRQLPQPAKSCSKPIPGSRHPSKLGHGTGYTWRKHDSFIGTRVKIVHGPYRGYRGCVKGVNGQNVRVELEAEMKVITVERNHISDKFAVSNPCNTPQHKTGGETPMHPRTPVHSMGGETPWRTPFQNPHPSTPIHYGSRESAYKQWNPCSMTSSTRIVPSLPTP